MYDDTVEYLNGLTILKQELQELVKEQSKQKQKKTSNVKWFGWKEDNAENEKIVKKRNEVRIKENELKIVIGEIPMTTQTKHLSQILTLRYIENRSFQYIANDLAYTSYPKVNSVKQYTNKKLGIKTLEELDQLIQDSIDNNVAEIGGLSLEVLKIYRNVYNNDKSLGVWYVKHILHKKSILKIQKILIR